MVPLSVILLTPVPVSVQVPLAIVVVPLQVEAAVIALVGVAPRGAVQPEARLNALPWSLVMTTLLKGEPVQVKVVVWPLSVSSKIIVPLLWVKAPPVMLKSRFIFILPPGAVNAPPERVNPEALVSIWLVTSPPTKVPLAWV